MVHQIDTETYYECGWGGPDNVSSSPNFNDSAFAIHD